MVIGGIKHREQRFNSRSAGVSSALLFISIGGMHGLKYNVRKILQISTNAVLHRQINKTELVPRAVNVVPRCVCPNALLEDLR